MAKPHRAKREASPARKLRAERRALGQCIECGALAELNRATGERFTHCRTHRELNNQRSREAHERARRRRGVRKVPARSHPRRHRAA